MGNYVSLVLLEPQTTPTTTPIPTITTTTGVTCVDTCSDSNVSLYIIIGLLTSALIIILLGLGMTGLYFWYYKRKYHRQTQSVLPNGSYRSGNTQDNNDEFKMTPIGKI